MFVEIAPSVYRAALLVLLSARLSSMAPKVVDIPNWQPHDAANLLVDKLLGVGKSDGDKVCDETNKSGHDKSIKRAIEAVTKVYTDDGHDAVAAAGKIKEAVSSVASNKMCTPSKKFVAVYSQMNPKPLAGIKPCDSKGENAVDHYKSNKNTFKKASFKALFPSCDCELESYIAAGQMGVVFLVKVGKDNVPRAMKITECGYLQEEIYAQEKLASEPWVIQMHGWGRSSGDKPKWEYYIMDLIGATVENAYKDKGKGVSDEQLKEVMRLTLEAARVLHTKYSKTGLFPIRIDLVHADLKSDNLAFMADDPKHVKLIDFGLVAPVTDTNAIAAYLDYWRIIETIGYHHEAFGDEGVLAILNLLQDEAATQILDGKPFAKGTNDFPKKAFFDTYLYGKIMNKFVDLKWIDSKSKGNPDTVLKTLFSKDKLPAVKFNPLINQ